MIAKIPKFVRIYRYHQRNAEDKGNEWVAMALFGESMEKWYEWSLPTPIFRWRRCGGTCKPNRNDWAIGGLHLKPVYRIAAG